MALQKVEDAIAKQFVTHTNHHQPLVLITFKLTVTPAGLFWQSNPMVWIHLPSSLKEVLLPYCDAVSEFVILGRENGRKHFGIEPAELFSLTPDLRSTGFHRTQTQGLLPGPQAGGLDDHRLPDRRIQFRKSHALISP